MDLSTGKNSYIVDFLLHGQLKRLSQDNRMNATEAWASVAGFLDALKMVQHAVAQVQPEEKREESTAGAAEDAKNAKKKKDSDIFVETLGELVAELGTRLRKN